MDVEGPAPPPAGAGHGHVRIADAAHDLYDVRCEFDDEGVYLLGWITPGPHDVLASFVFDPVEQLFMDRIHVAVDGAVWAAERKGSACVGELVEVTWDPQTGYVHGAATFVDERAATDGRQAVPRPGIFDLHCGGWLPAGRR